MSLPPSSSDLTICLSPPLDLVTGPEEEVLMLVEQANNNTNLCPALSNALTIHESDFLDIFGRHVELLKSRSQAFEDAHITVYDKTLLKLTNNGNDLKSPAAMQYFCEQFLSINTMGGAKQVEPDLFRSLKIPKILRQADSQCLSSAPPAKNNDHRTSPEKSTQTTIPSRPEIANTDLNMNRLWATYEQARVDYFAVATEAGDRAIRAAKFLRDTAENTLEYFKDKTAEANMMAELQATYDMAKAAVVSLTGGKKRKFDSLDVKREPKRRYRGNSEIARRTPSDDYDRVAHHRDPYHRVDGAGYRYRASVYRPRDY